MVTKISVILLVLSALIYLIQSTSPTQAELKHFVSSNSEMMFIDSPIIKYSAVFDTFTEENMKMDDALMKSKSITRRGSTLHNTIFSQTDSMERLVNVATVHDTVIIESSRKGFIYRMFHRH